MQDKKVILGIETSCDDTAVSIVEGPNESFGVNILSNVLSSSASLQSKYGGVVPEQAAREQLGYIIPTIQEAFYLAGMKPEEIDAIAVTQGPGLIGSLLVGVETAKALALAWDKPLVPVNHLLGHFYANWIESSSLRAIAKQSQSEIATSPSAPRDDIPMFPCIGLLISGGHTDLVLFTNHGKHQYLGGTRDDASGECFDKSARALGLSYPGGPQLAKLAENGDPNRFKLPRPMINSSDYDFSFSGLKTAVVNQLKQIKSAHQQIPESEVANLCASIQEAIVDVLVKKTVRAAKEYQVEQIIVAGGVAANTRLAEKLTTAFHGRVTIPPPQLCTDNGAMIAAGAIYNFNPQDPLQVEANPNLFW